LLDDARKAFQRGELIQAKTFYVVSHSNNPQTTGVRNGSPDLARATGQLAELGRSSIDCSAKGRACALLTKVAAPGTSKASETKQISRLSEAIDRQPETGHPPITIWALLWPNRVRRTSLESFQRAPESIAPSTPEAECNLANAPGQLEPATGGNRSLPPKQ